MMPAPMVTVICLCYNQERFVKDAILSVANQSYPNVQLVVVDDASTDNSVEVINACMPLFPRMTFIPFSVNRGSCRAFNEALRHAEGSYVIDLAADDVLLPGRIESGVEALENAGDSYGVNFSDAEWIREDGSHLWWHSDRFPHDTIPQGDIYSALVERFFICSPTMIFRKSVIDSLEGYDETLAYEDFDFWIRSSRHVCYNYTPKALVKKRVVKNSMSQKQFSLFSDQLHSTFRVCEKIMALNTNTVEQRALERRLRYEMRICLRLLQLPLFFKYIHLYRMNKRVRFTEG